MHHSVTSCSWNSVSTKNMNCKPEWCFQVQVAFSLQRFVLWKFTVTTGLKPGQKYKKTIKISKVYNHKYGIHVKKQHSKSEMTAIPITI
jgi:hypothetical protein